MTVTDRWLHVLAIISAVVLVSVSVFVLVVALMGDWGDDDGD